MNIVKEKIEELLAGSFTHELIEVTLTQQTNENPKMFTGSGFFYYKNNKIHLK
ncbi:hypothetical protein CVB54_003456, partial [Salmonella enterica subsp. enterica serovar London]|nr:hypothetical protein [Salmonella enterica subsp. enterica serovar London]